MKRHYTYELKQGLLAFTLLFGMTVNSVADAAGYSGYANILYIEPTDSAFYMQLDTAEASDPLGCANFDGYFLFVNSNIDPNQTHYNQLYATALTAFALNKKVSIYSTTCYTYPNGTRIQLLN